MDTYPILVKLMGIVGIASGLTVLGFQAAKFWPLLKDATRWHPLIAIAIGLTFSIILFGIIQPDLGTASQLASVLFVGILSGFSACGLYDLGHKLMGG
ncbi:MAG TPA: hypothetical protein VM223_27115 [Planctomycetota bacterium]|nr:hypothetical protein [Planctomycetota bacterium]